MSPWTMELLAEARAEDLQRQAQAARMGRLGHYGHRPVRPALVRKSGQALVRLGCRLSGPPLTVAGRP
jgi:hypothetical protein